MGVSRDQSAPLPSAEGVLPDPDGPRRVLVVSFRFPPHGGGGVHRVAAFTKYLPRFGWEPHVVTGPWNPSRSAHDPSVMAKIPGGVTVHRTGHLSTKALRRNLRRARLLPLVDAVTPTFPMMDGGWIPHGYRTGCRLLDEGGFDLIYSSGYPMASHVVGYLLKRRTGLPWVADYRDEWSIRSVLSWPTPVHRAVAKRIDRALTGAADVVVTTSPTHTRTFAAAFPHGGEARYVTITNGFDEEDFAGEVPTLTHPPRTDRFTLAHVGTFNASRDADGLLAAVRGLVGEGRIPADRIELLFVGKVKGLDGGDLEEMGILRVADYVPHPQAVGTMRTADALLLLNREVENVLGKTFEYLAAGRPIVGLLVEGATAKLVRETGAGTVVDPGDVGGIRALLLEFYSRWERGSLAPSARPAVVRRYSRHETTRALAGVFRELAGRGVEEGPSTRPGTQMNSIAPEGA